MTTATVTPYGVLHHNLDLLKAAAAISDAGYGVWAYEQWEQHNAAYFGGALRPGGISWGLTPHGHALGYYEGWRNHITLHVSLVQPRRNAWGIAKLLGPLFAADVLLHEMIHQAIYQTHGAAPGPDGSHNNPLWCSEIMRLSPLALGIEVKAEPVKLRRVGGQPMRKEREGYLSRRAIASWPDGLRPAGYYEPAVAELASKAGNL